MTIQHPYRFTCAAAAMAVALISGPVVIANDVNNIAAIFDPHAETPPPPGLVPHKPETDTVGIVLAAPTPEPAAVPAILPKIDVTASKPAPSTSIVKPSEPANPLQSFFSDLFGGLASLVTATPDDVSAVTSADHEATTEAPSAATPDAESAETKSEPTSAPREPATTTTELTRPDRANAAAPSADQPTSRNPLLWLLSDLAELFKGSETQADTRYVGAPEATPEVAPKAALDDMAIQAPSPASGDGALIAIAETDTPRATTTRNPISWLLGDIAAWLAGASKTIDAPDSAREIETAVAAEMTPTTTVAEPSTAAPLDSASETSSSDPIAELFSGLAAFFAPAPAVTDEPAAAVVETAATVETPPTAAVAEFSGDEAAVDEPESEQSNPIAKLFDGLAAIFGATPTPADEPAAAPIIETVGITEAPKSEDDAAIVDAAAPETALPNAFTAMFRQLGDLLAVPDVTGHHPPASSPSPEPVQVAAIDPGAGGSGDISDQATGIRHWISRGVEKLLEPRTEDLPKPDTAGRTAVRRGAPSDDASNLTAPPDLTRATPEQRPRRRVPLDQIPLPASGQKHKAVTQDDSEINPVIRFFSGFGRDDKTGAPGTVQNRDDATATRAEPTSSDPNLVPDDQLELAHVSIDDPPRTRREATGTPPLADEVIGLADGMVIGRSLVQADNGPTDCIRKDAFDAAFCIENISWPASVAGVFAKATVLPNGTRAIVRYDGGKASRFGAWYPADDFLDVVKFFQRQYGPPSERLIVWMPMLEAPRIANPTFRWLSIPSNGDPATVLEVRSFDDVRRSFPDMKQGLVRLYREGSEPVFRHLSTIDLMLMAKRRLTLAPSGADGSKSAKASGTR